MSEIQAIIDRDLNGLGAVIEEECNASGLDVALGCALVEKESGGRNIFGHDHAWAATNGDRPPYYGHVVTRERVEALMRSEYMNGVGVTQLTWWTYVEEAHFMGGAHLPRYQCRVAFRLMMSMLARYGYARALASYNAGDENWYVGIENGYAEDLARRHDAWTQKLPKQNGGHMVKAQDIIDSAYKLQGVFYRTWYLGDPLPMWRKDGYAATEAPPVEHMVEVGVMCSDLVNWALCDNGLQPGYGTEAFADYLVDTVPFDPSDPGVPGAICLSPYRGPALSQQGHIGIYVDEHTIIQALVSTGVTDAYTDAETYGWGGATMFTTYGFLPGVDYSDAPGGNPSPGEGKPSWDHGAGWYEIFADWSCKWHGSEK